MSAIAMDGDRDIPVETADPASRLRQKGRGMAPLGHAVARDREGSELPQTTASDGDRVDRGPFGQDDPYVQFLLSRKEQSFYMKPWSGNSGDALIWLGTEYLLRDLKVIRSWDPRKADIILIPGGNQTMWQENIDVWKEAWTRWPDKEFVVGPTTARMGYTTWRQDVEQLGRNVAGIFARDPESHATLRECGLSGRIEIGLSHDPALYLWDSDLIRAHRQAATEEFVLAAFRQDQEGVVDLATRRTRWESLLPFFVTRRLRRRRIEAHKQKRIALVSQHTRRVEPIKACDASLYIFEYFVELIRSAAEVHTDRLHCMLLAAMLGKPTYAYQTRYGKLEAVYEHSLKNRAHVEFVEDARALPGGAGRLSLAPADVAQP